ncbi:MAG: prephenate/arogenate dehydrogenase family protein [Alphaproteobacteria bacterium]
MAGAAPPLFRRAAIVGLGLIGGSLALRLKRDGTVGAIVGCARSQRTLDVARGRRMLDDGTTDPAAAVADADLVVLCTPLGSYKALAAAIGPHLAPGAVVTDVGSVKASVLADVAPHLPAGVALVPGHPVAGTENSGPEAGFPELFERHRCILTPPPDADPAAVAAVQALWERCGATVDIMDAAHHDIVLALTSHLPHVIAYTIVGTATELEQDLQSEVVKFSAGGFRDFTRIAASDPTMWRDIFLANREAVLEVISRFDEDLTRLKRAIRRGDGEALYELFERTRQIRRSILAANPKVP